MIQHKLCWKEKLFLSLYMGSFKMYTIFKMINILLIGRKGFFKTRYGHQIDDFKSDDI